MTDKPVIDVDHIDGKSRTVRDLFTARKNHHLTTVAVPSGRMAATCIGRWCIVRSVAWGEACSKSSWPTIRVLPRRGGLTNRILQPY